MNVRVNKVITKILDLLSPPQCIICERPLFKGHCFCEHCIALFARVERKKCPICLKEARSCTCRPYSLIETDTIGEKVLISLAFLSPADSKDIRDIFIRRYIYHIKRSEVRFGIPFAARALAHEILKLLTLQKLNISDFIITNPPRSLLERSKYGFDQGKELAESISEYTGIKYVKCLKRKTNRMQKMLNAHERKANADKAYAFIDGVDIRGKNVIIADDVITTGATLNACTSILKKNGAALVFPVSVARTKKRKRSARNPRKSAPWFKGNKMKIMK